LEKLQELAKSTLLNALQTERDTVEELESALSTVQQNNSAILEMVSSRDSLIDELNDRVAVFEEDKVVLKAALRQLQKEMKEEGPKFKKMEGDLEVAQDVIDQLKTELKTLKTTHTTQLTNLTLKLSAHQNTINETDSKMSMISIYVDQLEERLASFAIARRQITEREVECRKIEEDVAEKEEGWIVTERQMGELVEERDGLKNLAELLVEERSGLQKERRELKVEGKELKVRGEVLEGEICVLKEDLVRVEEEVGEVRREYDFSEMKCVEREADVRELQARSKELASDVERKEETINVSLVANTGLEEEMERLKEEMKQLGLEKEEALSLLSAVEDEKEDISSILSTVVEEKEETLSLLSTLKEDNEETLALLSNAEREKEEALALLSTIVEKNLEAPAEAEPEAEIITGEIEDDNGEIPPPPPPPHYEADEAEDPMVDSSSTNFQDQDDNDGWRSDPLVDSNNVGVQSYRSPQIQEEAEGEIPPPPVDIGGEDLVVNSVSPIPNEASANVVEDFTDGVETHAPPPPIDTDGGDQRQIVDQDDYLHSEDTTSRYESNEEETNFDLNAPAPYDQVQDNDIHEVYAPHPANNDGVEEQQQTSTVVDMDLSTTGGGIVEEHNESAPLPPSVECDDVGDLAHNHEDDTIDNESPTRYYNKEDDEGDAMMPLHIGEDGFQSVSHGEGDTGERYGLENEENVDCTGDDADVDEIVYHDSQGNGIEYNSNSNQDEPYISVNVDHPLDQNDHPLEPELPIVDTAVDGDADEHLGSESDRHVKPSVPFRAVRKVFARKTGIHSFFTRSSKTSS